MIFRNTTRQLRKPSFIPEKCWLAAVEHWEKIEADLEDFELPSGQERWAHIVGYGLGFRDRALTKRSTVQRDNRGVNSSIATLKINHSRLF